MGENKLSFSQPHGGNIYRQPGILDFSASINPLGMPQSVREAAVEGVLKSEAYPDPDLTELTKAYCAFHHVPAERIVFGNGASELIRALPAAIRKPESHAAVVLPCFSEYTAACACAGMQIRAVSFDTLKGGVIPENDKSQPDLLIIGNPSNPDGRIFTRENILRLAEHYPMTAVCVDESFLPFCADAQERSVIPCLSEHRNLFVIRSFTKIYAMPGLRLGALLGADEHTLSVVRGLLQPWTVSVPAQAAGIAALHENRFVQDTVRFLVQERTYLEQKLTAVPFVDKVMASPADYILFHVKERQPHELFRQLLLQNIQIRDCSSFDGLELLISGADAGAKRWKSGWYRIAVRAHEENERLMAALRKIQKI